MWIWLLIGWTGASIPFGMLCGAAIRHFPPESVELAPRAARGLVSTSLG